MKLTYLSNSQIITLDTENDKLGGGGEGTVYKLSQDPSLIAKVYHDDKLNDSHREKLRIMLANPISNLSREGFVAWPIDLLLSDEQQIIGFLMPRVTGVLPIHQFYTPKDRRKHIPGFNYRYLHRTARNLAAAIGKIHQEEDYVIGDVNESNILVTETALVTLVDTDSFQVRDSNKGKIYKCPVGKQEYTPPELQGKNFRDAHRTQEHDLFGLGVLIFQLLMEGVHPFDGAFQGSGETPRKSERILQGHFPYSRNKKVPYAPKPTAPPFKIIHPRLRELFFDCFEQGHDNPQLRPNAKTWLRELELAEKDLITCSSNNQHLYGKHRDICPWCERAKLLGVDFFSQSSKATTAVSSPKVRTTPKTTSPSQHTPRRNIPATTSTPVKPLTLRKTPPTTRKSPLTKFFSPPLTKALAVLGVLGVATTTPFIPSLITNFQTSISKQQEIRTISTARKISLVRTLKHNHPVISVAISPDGQTIVSDDADGTMKIWDLATGKLKFTLEGYNDSVILVRISPDGQTIVSGGNDNTIKIWDLATGQLKSTLPAHNVYLVAISADGQTIVSVSRDNTIKIWDLATGKLKSTLNHKSLVSLVAISPDGQTIVSSSDNKTIKIWDLATGQLKSTLTHNFYLVAISPDGQTLVSSGNTIKIWDLATGKLKNTLTGHNVWFVAISPDGRTIVSGGGYGDKTIKIWDLATGKLKNTLTGHNDWIYSIAISPDGRTIVSGGGNDYNTIKVWDLATGQLKFTLKGHNYSVNSVAISPDGRTIVSEGGYYDNTIKIWEAR